MGLLTNDIRCDHCYGSGRQWDYKEGAETDELCDYCKGTRRELQQVGRELIEFLRDHYGLEVVRR